MSYRDNKFVGDFYTAGQSKCDHCGLYYPNASITSHEANCHLNPANQVPPPPTEDGS